MQAEFAQTFCERDDVRRDHRLASGYDRMPGRVRFHLCENLVQGKLRALRIPRRVRRVAPGATQVASARADENRGHAHERAFTLQRIKQVSDLQFRPRQNPCAAEGTSRTLRTARRQTKGHSSYVSTRRALP